MNKTDKKFKKGSNGKVLIMLSILLILVGGMITDPFAGLVCFTLAGIISLVTVLMAAKWVKYVALFLLAAVVLLMISQFPQARDHYLEYRDKSASRNTH
jgi:uncharacterized membrane protein